MKYECSNGVTIKLIDIFAVKQGLVFTGTIEKLPNDEKSIRTDLFDKIMNGEEILGKKISGTEWFASAHQNIGSNIGLFVKLDKK